MRAARHPQEAARLDALRSYGVLDTPREDAFDDLANLASRICETPVALITLLDVGRQWFKAAVGTDVTETPFDQSLCAHAILERGLVEANDLTHDPRFADNPLVTGDLALRFYAGMPLETPGGLPLGTLCVLDTRPRVLTDLQREALRVLGRQAMTELELRRRIAESEAERRAVEDTLARAEIGTWRFDVATGEIAGNPRAERFYDVAGRVPLARVREAIHPEDRAGMAAAHAEAIRAGGRYESEYRATGADGQERWLLARGDVELGADGRPAALSGVSIDVTARRRAEDALAAERRQTEEALSQAEVGTWVRTRDPDRVRYNAVFRRLYGLPEDQTVEVPLDDVMGAIHPDDREPVRLGAARAAFEGLPYEMEYRVTDAQGRERWVLARGNRLSNTSALSGVVIDVTERRRAQDALEAERAGFRRLLDEVPAHIVVLRGPDLRYEFANRAFLAFVGREPDFYGMRAQDAWPVPDDHLAMLRGILAGGEAVRGREVPVERPDGGGLAYFDFLFEPLREPDGTPSGIFVHSFDVTEKVLAQEARRASEERFRAAQETTPDAFTILESVRDEAGAVVDFRYVYLNPAAETLGGQTREDAMGRTLLEMRPWNRENGLFDAFVRVVETGEPFSRDAHAVPDSQAYVRVTAVRVGDGIAVSFADVTHRHLAEERLKEAVEARTKELREAVQEAERFNYSISHDLRTPLRAISMTAQILLEEAGPELTDLHRELLERQAHNARRLGGLIDGLLRLSRLGRVAMAPVPLDLTETARAIAEEIARAGEHPCAVEVQEGLGAVGDPNLVRLLLSNLVENACKFSRGQGTVRVGREGAAFFVRDEGVGFDMKYADKLFKPFERLVREDEFPGTGIGLANVERIVRRHGGRVWAESEPDRGATFWFTLGGSGLPHSGGGG